MYVHCRKILLYSANRTLCICIYFTTIDCPTATPCNKHTAIPPHDATLHRPSLFLHSLCPQAARQTVTRVLARSSRSHSVSLASSVFAREYAGFMKNNPIIISALSSSYSFICLLLPHLFTSVSRGV